MGVVYSVPSLRGLTVFAAKVSKRSIATRSPTVAINTTPISRSNDRSRSCVGEINSSPIPASKRTNLNAQRRTSVEVNAGFFPHDCNRSREQDIYRKWRSYLTWKHCSDFRHITDAILNRKRNCGESLKKSFPLGRQVPLRPLHERMGSSAVILTTDFSDDTDGRNPDRYACPNPFHPQNP